MNEFEFCLFYSILYFGKLMEQKVTQTYHFPSRWATATVCHLSPEGRPALPCGRGVAATQRLSFLLLLATR